MGYGEGLVGFVFSWFKEKEKEVLLFDRGVRCMDIR